MRESGMVYFRAKLLLIILGFVATVRADDSLSRWERAEPHMGSTFHLVLYGTDQQAADDAFRAAFDRIRELDAIMSNYKKASELNRLCLGAPHDQAQPVSDDLFRVLKRADLTSRQSDGAFDVTVGPLTRLWRQTRRTRIWPDKDRLQEALAPVGYQAVELDDAKNAVRLTRARMELDLGGIGAGFALDEVAELLERRGFTQFMIDSSGDIRVAGAPPDRHAWRIAIGGLREGEDHSGYLSLRDRSVATSGDLHQYFPFDGKRYSHLIDPKTGIGLTVPSSVTVIARDGVTADVWSTTVAVMGIERGIERILEHPEWEIEVRATWLEGDQRRVRETPAFAAYWEERSQEDDGSVRSSN